MQLVQAFLFFLSLLLMQSMCRYSFQLLFPPHLPPQKPTVAVLLLKSLFSFSLPPPFLVANDIFVVCLCVFSVQRISKRLVNQLHLVLFLSSPLPRILVLLVANWETLLGGTSSGGFGVSNALFMLAYFKTCGKECPKRKPTFPMLLLKKLWW